MPTPIIPHVARRRHVLARSIGDGLELLAHLPVTHAERRELARRLLREFNELQRLEPPSREGGEAA